MAKFRRGGKVYHGESRNSKEGTRALTGGGSQTVILDAAKHDTFDISTDATGSTAVTVSITNASAGQRIIVRYLSGGGSDTLAAITVNGTASTLLDAGALDDSAENALEVIVYSDSASHYIIHSVA